MKRITLKQLSLMNFKGIRKATIKFDDASTSIVGANGTGKTTVFDAFTWVMFGIDSFDRKDFDIKTLGSDGAVTYHPFVSEVSALLDVDGEQISITRRYKEKWVKTKGEAEEHFAGHAEERLYNDVPCSVADFKLKIEDICPMKIFKFITSPYCFCAQKMIEQREMLISMAGGVSDDEIASGNEDFKKLMTMLTGKTFDEFKREIGAKKKRIKAEIDELPIRIDQCNNLMPADCDYQAIENEIAEKEKALNDIDAQLTDMAKSYEAAHSAHLATQREITNAQYDLFKLEQEITAEVQDEYMRQIKAKEELSVKEAGLRSQLASIERNIASNESQISYNDKEIEACAKRRAKLLEEWNAVNAEKISFNDSEFVCPTCNRRYEASEIASKQQEMIARFNASRSERLAENKRKGMENNAAKNNLVERNNTIKGTIDTLKVSLEDVKKKIDDVRQQIASMQIGEKPDASSAIESNEKRKSLLAKIDELNAKLQSGASEASSDTSELKEMKAVMQESLKSLREQLANKNVAENIKKQIIAHQEALRNQSEELARLEQIEFVMMEFGKARINAVEDRINRMFQFVTFKMFDQQVNGAIVEDCEAIVNGVPFSSLNHAMQINAGLDIINALTKHQGICAPIFIDNAESIINVGATNSQIVKLVVADQPLRVIGGEMSDYEKA